MTANNTLSAPQWKMTPFAELATFETGKTPARAVPEYWATDKLKGTPWISISDMTPYGLVADSAEYITPRALTESFRGRISKAGTLLMSFKLTIGRVSTLAVDACHNEAIISIHPNDRVNQKYLEYFLSHVDYADYQDRAVKGNTLNQEKINRILVAEPEKAEQEKIAALLWLVQQAVESERKLVATTRQLKQAAMKQLFHRGLRNEPTKESDIGEVPDHWQVVPLGSLGRIGNGSTPLKGNAAYWTGGTIPWLTSAKVYDVTVTQADQFVTPLAVKECHLPRVPSGSVLIAITGQGKTLGHAAVTALETCVSQHVAYVQFSKDLNPHFIRLFLDSCYSQLRSVAQSGGSTKGALTCAFLKSFAVPLPPREEQDAIATALMLIEEKLTVHSERSEVLQRLFDSLLTRLMSGDLRIGDLDIDTSAIAPSRS